MTDQTPDLAALEALAEAATPGPWSVGRHRDGHAVAIDDADGYSDVVGPGPVDCMAYCYGGVSTIEWTDATAAYVAAADPATVLWLIREVARLTARAEKAEATIARIEAMPVGPPSGGHFVVSMREVRAALDGGE